MVRTKRVYEAPSAADGTRVLVMRLWPRGIRKEAVDLWLKELGAELANLRAYNAGRVGWPEMRRRYLAGLRREPAKSALARLKTLAKRGRVTILCSCKDEKRCHRSLLRGKLGVLAALTLLSSLAAGWSLAVGPVPASAEHEVQYRYTVLGYFTDASGRPRAGVGLEVTRQKTGFAYQGETDARGLYVIVTRLADESRGERLLVRAGPASLWVTARFQPGDHATERGTRVDFTGDKVIEQTSLFQATLTRFLGR
jgi:uncharacterized protein YeaO (DUF488 family)